MKLWEVAQDTFALLSADWTVAAARRFLRGLKFTHIIVRRANGDAPEQVDHYLFRAAEAVIVLDRSSGNRSLRAALALNTRAVTESREGRTPADQAPERTAVLSDGEVIGFVDMSAQSHSGHRGQTRSMPSDKRFHGFGPTNLESFDPSSEPKSEDSAERLDAYPALRAPSQVAPQEAFEISVELGAEPDPLAEGSGLLQFRNIRPGDDCLVVLIATGADVDLNFGRLPLRHGARIEFRCRALSTAGLAALKVQFFFRNQLVGVAQHEVKIVESPKAQSLLGAGLTTSPGHLSLAGPENDVDITVTVTYSADGTLQWTWVAPVPALGTTSPILTRLDGAREFATDLLRDLKTVSFTGPEAADVLLYKGREVARLFPPQFFEDLKRVFAELRRAPTLLLVTNEAYVPWELAVLDDAPDSKSRPFLAAQTQMARWLEDKDVLLPPSATLDVHRGTAVAATYSLQSGLRELKEAVAERAKLVDRWDFVPLDAKLEDLRTVTRGTVVAGHLIHFAVHGLSDPEANDQVLLLADRKRLPASALAGGYRPGEVPRFRFVFLNACQVGTAGTSLGQAAGFPGILVRSGVAGFIAPLWEVDDLLAREFAERFYEQTLGGNTPIGGVLHAERGTYQEGSTTPLAYVYYGHPALRLKHFRT